jgi:DMSO reductase family type II enzyme chaperone
MLRILEPKENRGQKDGLVHQALQAPVSQTDPIPRCTIYRLFSTAFRYPTPDAYQEYRDGVYLAELWNNMSELYYMLPVLQERTGVADRIQVQLQGISYKDFYAEYVRTFNSSTSHSACSPFEGNYRKGPEKTTLLSELNDFYEQFGLRMNSEAAGREAPDHVSVEFEFLHYLVFKEAQSSQQEAGEFLSGYVLAQRDFLERHLNSWYPSFSRKLQRLTPLSFFTAIAGLAERFVTLDFDAVCSAAGRIATRCPVRPAAPGPETGKFSGADEVFEINSPRPPGASLSKRNTCMPGSA